MTPQHPHPGTRAAAYWEARRNARVQMWFDRPLPRRWHRCRPVQAGAAGLSYVERCACGALRYGADRPWIGRNSRRAQ